MGVLVWLTEGFNHYDSKGSGKDYCCYYPADILCHALTPSANTIASLRIVRLVSMPDNRILSPAIKPPHMPCSMFSIFIPSSRHACLTGQPSHIAMASITLSASSLRLALLGLPCGCSGNHRSGCGWVEHEPLILSSVGSRVIDRVDSNNTCQQVSPLKSLL